MQETDHRNSSTPLGATKPTGLDPGEVCTLSEDGIVDRMAWVQATIIPHAIQTERLEHGLGIEFSGTPQLAQDLDRLVRLESECCGGITFERLESETPGRMRLEIRGISPDAAAFRSFWTPAAGEVKPGIPARLAKSAGVGSAASVFVCCVIPTAAAALLGGIAAPLASLDGPVPIAFGALLSGAAVWWWLGRRGPARDGAGRPETACRSGC